MNIHRIHDAQTEFDRINDVFERLFNPAPRTPSAGFLPLDILEKENTLFIRASLPGVQAEDVDIQLEGRVLTIKGNSRRDGLYQEAKIYRRELAMGEFARSLRIADGFDLGAVMADVEDGIVEIRIPRAESEKSRTIRVGVRSSSEVKDLPAQEGAAEG